MFWSQDPLILSKSIETLKRLYLCGLYSLVFTVLLMNTENVLNIYSLKNPLYVKNMCMKNTCIFQDKKS